MIDENHDDDEDLEPRPISIIKRSNSAPVTAPVPPPAPPPPPPDLIMPKPFTPNFVVKKMQEFKPQPGYSVTPEEIQKRLHSLKKIKTVEDDPEAEGDPDNLVDLMRKVIVQRRETTGWCDSSSNASSDCKLNGKLTINSSWDDL